MGDFEFLIKMEDPEQGIIFASLTSFSPLGKSELLQKDTIKFNIKGNVKQLLVNGIDKTQENTTFSCPTQFHSNLKVFSLVTNGWLPPTFSVPPVFLLDRNVLSAFQGYRNGIPGYQENCWWFDVFKNTQSNPIEINTLFSALEGELQILPDFDVFLRNIQKYDEVIRKEFNHVKNTLLNETQLRRIYKYVSNRDYNNKINFLLECTPLIFKSSSYKNKREILDKILELGFKYKFNSTSHLLILAIACVYESPSSYKFARKILKPKEKYTKKMAHNCVFDVFFIDLILLFKFYINKNYSGVTADKAIAVYWSSIMPRINHEEVDFKVTLKLRGLFEGATKNDLQYILTELNKL